MKGRWAQGLEPRFFCWIIQDRLAGPGVTRESAMAAVGTVSAGAEVLHEPRVWPEYHPNYYGAFVRDPDGNNVEAVCHSPE